MPIIVNAIPKSGTNMLCRLLDLLGMGRDGSVDFSPKNARFYPRDIDYDDSGLIRCGATEVPLSAARVGIISRPEFDDRVSHLCSLAPHAYIEAHMLHSSYAACKLAQKQVKMIIIMRDPRAVALSHADWFVDPISRHTYREIMTPLSLKARLHCEFFGLPADHDPGLAPLIPILARYRNMLPWRDYPYLHVTTFEALVGEQGGGSLREQSKAIDDIGRFIGITDIDHQAIQKSLWGESGTFRNGLIHRWAEHAAEFPDNISGQIAEMTQIVDLLLGKGG